MSNPAGHDDQTTTPIRTSGVGSMPGISAGEAAAISAGEFDIPFLAELPARGPGSDLIGRSLGLIRAATGEFAAETTPGGWRLSGVRAGGDAGRAMRRAQSWLGEDLDALEAALQGFVGTVKVSVAGPWTLAGATEGRTGSRLVADASACTDLAEALAQAAQGLVEMVHRRVPGASVMVQFDEPGLGAVRVGSIPTPSGRGRLRAPADSELVAALTLCVAAARGVEAEPALHCCAASVPFAVLERAGFDVLSIDPRALGAAADTDLGAWWDRGGTVALGVAPSTDDPLLAPENLARRTAGLWHRIGFGPEAIGERTLLTPSCGLAGASPDWSRRVGQILRRAARMLASVD